MDYWKECIKEAFEDAGLTATDDQVEVVTSWVEGAHDNYGMFRGYDSIQNPKESKLVALEKRIKEIEVQHKKQLLGIAEGVAMRRNVDVRDVDIDHDGRVTFRV